MKAILHFLICCLLCFVGAVSAQQTWYPYQQWGSYLPPIDSRSREQVINLYNWIDATRIKLDTEAYQPISPGWDGVDFDNCKSGSLNPFYVERVIRRTNFARVLAGTNSLRVGSDVDKRKVQEGALIQARAARDDWRWLGHYPPPSAKCWSDLGYAGTSQSNLGGDTSVGERHINVFLDDAGDGNYHVAHRRNILLPYSGSMTFGSIPANRDATGAMTDSIFKAGNYLLTVLNVAPEVNNRQPSKREYVTWPTEGFMPYDWYPIQSKRWSISCGDCAFDRATVEVLHNGVVETITLEQIASAGGDPSLVWRLENGPTFGFSNLGFHTVTPPAVDLKYDVVVRNIGKRTGDAFSGYTTQYGREYRYSVTLINPADTKGAHLPKKNYSGLWWNPNESGWGIALSQGVSGAIFAGWYTYDEAGDPIWIYFPGGQWTDSQTQEGAIYRATGPWFGHATFDPAKVDMKVIGSYRMRFHDENHATITYTAMGVTRDLPIERNNIAPVNARDGTNYTGIWGNIETENGWGFSITHDFDTVFGVWYTFGEDGKPVWMFMPGGKWIGANKYQGTLYRARGTFFNAPWNPAAHTLQQLGTATVDFTSNESAFVEFVVDGAKQTKLIKRYLY